MASNKLDVSDLDFDNIKTNLKTFLQSQPEFSDYNFEPRVNLVQVLANPDLDRNSYHLRIMFYVVGVPEPVTVETFLERLR